MNKVSESIFSNDDLIIPMADVQHIEKVKHGILVITKHTTWDFEHDTWKNNIFISNTDGKSEAFIAAWCLYRYELEGGKEAFKEPL